MSKKTHILFILLLSICACLLWPGVSVGLTPKQAYISGESCYKKLRNSPAKMKYRDNWSQCIQKFQRVYRLDPTGPWAAAGLYMSGKLYEELAKRSGKKSDLLEARDIYGRIIKRYPSSRYQNKAALQLRNLSTTKKKQKQKQPVPKNFGMIRVDP
jgi:N-acetylmuramoyl-L-alanine amidase